MAPKRRRHARFLIALTLLAGLFCTAPVSARELVTCRYLAASGTRIEIELNVGAPPPATLIVTQNLPPDVSVVETSQPVKKFSQRPGEAKWLLMGIRPGTTLLGFTLNKAIRPGQISGEMLYNAPDSGVMVRMPFSP